MSRSRSDMASATGRIRRAALGGTLLVLVFAAGCGNGTTAADEATEELNRTPSEAASPAQEQTPAPTVTVTPTSLPTDLEAVCVDGLADVDETMRDAIAAARGDEPTEGQRLLHRAADDLDALATRADDELEDGDLADALEDYAAVIRYGDDLDALAPAQEDVRAACLLTSIG